METTCIVGTDIATFFLYEPDALRHRATSPWCWFADWTDTGDDRSGLTVPELSDGRLVMINTAVPIYVGEPERLTWIGSDGAYVFRCTTGGLTPDERDREYPETHAQAEASLLHVTQGRVLLDGGYLIPYDTTGERVLTLADALDKELVAWLELPNGTYTVTAHHLEPSGAEEPDDDEATIVLTFDRVDQ